MESLVNIYYDRLSYAANVSKTSLLVDIECQFCSNDIFRSKKPRKSNWIKKNIVNTVRTLIVEKIDESDYYVSSFNKGICLDSQLEMKAARFNSQSYRNLEQLQQCIFATVMKKKVIPVLPLIGFDNQNVRNEDEPIQSENCFESFDPEPCHANHLDISRLKCGPHS